LPGHPPYPLLIFPVVLLPLFFIAMWLMVGALLGVMTGWSGLSQAYPDTGEAALLTLRWQSGMMGAGVRINGVLTLSACPSGLRVAVSRWFFPFSRPFLAPWADIRAEAISVFFFPMARLTFGDPDVGKLRIYADSWRRLHDAAHPQAPSGVPAVANADLATALALWWIVFSALAAGFFYAAPRLAVGPADAAAHGWPPLAVCIGFPTLVFGAGCLIEYLRLRRPQ